MKNDVYICQHDTLTLTTQLTKDNGTTYTLQSGDTLWLTAKKEIGGTALLDVTSDVPTFTIGQISLDVGTYLLEIGITYASGIVETIIQSHLVITERLKGASV